MVFRINVVLTMLLTLMAWQIAESEDCALAGKSNKQGKPVKNVTARRMLVSYGPEMMYKFGITYPPGAAPARTTPSGPPTLTDPVWTMRTIVTENPYPWKDHPSYKTPPTNFFPLGSTDVTVTLRPLTFLYVHSKSALDPCDMWIRSCFRAYETGWVCAQALHGVKHTFSTYCAMEFANCNLKSNIWRLLYFGNCAIQKIPDAGEDFDIEGDNFLEAGIVNAPPFNPLTGRQETYM